MADFKSSRDAGKFGSNETSVCLAKHDSGFKHLNSPKTYKNVSIHSKSGLLYVTSHPSFFLGATDSNFQAHRGAESVREAVQQSRDISCLKNYQSSFLKCQKKRPAKTT